MPFNPRYGRVVMLDFTNSCLVDVLGPLAEVISYLLVPFFWETGALNADFMMVYVALFFLFSVFISAHTLILEELELCRVPHTYDLALLAF